MKVVVSTVGRFHLFALARELHRNEMLERIYSGFNWAALRREALPRQRVGTFPVVRPAMMALRFLPIEIPYNVGAWLHYLSAVAQDAYVAGSLPACDAFVGHESSGLWTGRAAKERGSLYVCDRDATHAAWRDALLREEHAIHKTPYENLAEKTIERELREYELADKIVVPSRFAADSFFARGVSASKIEIIPYGVDVGAFRPDGAPAENRFDVIFVGNFSIRKGAPYLLEAFSKLRVAEKRLTIAGTMAKGMRDLIDRFGLRHKTACLGHVPHLRLRSLISKSHCLVLPSVEDGFGLVMAEALACGCPVIASTHTGAVDLFTHGEEGFIVPVRDSRAICDCMTWLADERDLRARMSAAAVDRVARLGGWDAYGDKYVGLLRAMNGKRADGGGEAPARVRQPIDAAKVQY